MTVVPDLPAVEALAAREDVTWIVARAEVIAACDQGELGDLAHALPSIDLCVVDELRSSGPLSSWPRPVVRTSTGGGAAQLVARLQQTAPGGADRPLSRRDGTLAAREERSGLDGA